MCRSVKIQITYLKMRLSLRLVRSLRTIRGRSRRFPHRSCSSLRTKWKAGEFAPFSQLLVSFAAVLVVLPFSFFFLVFSAPFPLMGPKRPKEKRKRKNDDYTIVLSEPTSQNALSSRCRMVEYYSSFLQQKMVL